MAHFKDEIREFIPLIAVTIDYNYIHKTQLKLLDKARKSISKEICLTFFGAIFTPLIRFIYSVKDVVFPFNDFTKNFIDYINIDFWFFIGFSLLSLVSFIVWKTTTPNIEDILSEVRSQVILK